MTLTDDERQTIIEALWCLISESASDEVDRKATALLEKLGEHTTAL